MTRSIIENHPSTTPKPFDQELGRDHARVAPVEAPRDSRFMLNAKRAGAVALATAAVIVGGEIFLHGADRQVQHENAQGKALERTIDENK